MLDDRDRAAAVLDGLPAVHVELGQRAVSVNVLPGASSSLRPTFATGAAMTCWPATLLQLSALLWVGMATFLSAANYQYQCWPTAGLA